MNKEISVMATLYQNKELPAQESWGKYPFLVSHLPATALGYKA